MKHAHKYRKRINPPVFIGGVVVSLIVIFSGIVYYYNILSESQSINLARPINVIEESIVSKELIFKNFRRSYTGKYQTFGEASNFISSDSFYNENHYLSIIKNNSNTSEYVVELDNYLVDSISCIVIGGQDTLVEFHLPDKVTKNRAFFDIDISKGDSVYVELFVQNKGGYSIPATIFSRIQFKQHEAKSQFVKGLYFGGFFIFLLISLIGVFTYKNIKYFYYALYIIFTSIFSLAESGILGLYSDYWNSFNELFVLSTILAGMIFLILFSIKLMPVSKQFSSFNDLGYFFVGLIVLEISVINSSFFYQETIFKVTYNAMFILIIIAYIYCILRAFFNQEKRSALRWLLIFGYAFLFIGVLTKPVSFLGFLDYNFLAKYGAMLGQFVELCCLSAYIVIHNYFEIEDRHQLKQDFVGLELKSLQSQMESHFVANTLTAIQDKIRDKDTEEYLNKFADLMRMFLEASKNRYITLEEEIRLLKLYVTLEKLRFENKPFEVKFDIDENIDVYTTEIPTFLLQPLVENAINHGIFNKKDGNGLLKVAMHQGKEQAINIVIEDNGVGMKKTIQAKQNRHKKDKSRGTQLIFERLNTLKEIEGIKFEIITEEMNPDLEEPGTRINIKLLIEC